MKNVVVSLLGPHHLTSFEKSTSVIFVTQFWAPWPWQSKKKQATRHSLRRGTFWAKQSPRSYGSKSQSTLNDSAPHVNCCSGWEFMNIATVTNQIESEVPHLMWQDFYAAGLDILEFQTIESHFKTFCEQNWIRRSKKALDFYQRSDRLGQKLVPILGLSYSVRKAHRKVWPILNGEKWAS